MKAIYALHFADGLSPADRKVAACLIWHANARTGKCCPTEQTIARRTGLHVKSVSRSVRRLMDAGIVDRTLRGKESSAYRIAWDRLADEFTAFEAEPDGSKRVTERLPKGNRMVN